MEHKDKELLLKELNKMGIHDLRTFARNSGVKSPTTLKKEQLIDGIIMVKSGEIEPVTSNMGRKPKATSNVSNEVIMPGLYDKMSLSSPIFRFNTDIITEDCILKFTDTGKPMLKLSQKTGRIVQIGVTPDFLDRYKLKRDDIVTAELRPLSDDSAYIAEKIVAINGIPASEYQSDIFYEIDKVPNIFDNLTIQNFDKFEDIMYVQRILKGYSYFYYYGDKEYIANFALDFANEVNEPDLNVVILNASHISTTPKPKAKNITIYNLDYNQSYDELLKTIVLAQEFIKNLFIAGKKVLFIVSEVDEIFRIFNFTHKEAITDEIAPESTTAISRLLNLAKYVSSKQNLTVVSFSSFTVEDNYKYVLENKVLPYLREIKLKRIKRK